MVKILFQILAELIKKKEKLRHLKSEIKMEALLPVLKK